MAVLGLPEHLDVELQLQEHLEHDRTS